MTELKQQNEEMEAVQTRYNEALGQMAKDGGYFIIPSMAPESLIFPE